MGTRRDHSRGSPQWDARRVDAARWTGHSDGSVRSKALHAIQPAQRTDAAHRANRQAFGRERNPLRSRAVCRCWWLKRAAARSIQPLATGWRRAASIGNTAPEKSCAAAIAPDEAVSYRRYGARPGGRTITLRRPLMLDLGAVAKGLAVMRPRASSRRSADFAIDAGGDLYLGGLNRKAPWSRRHSPPRRDGQTDRLSASRIRPYAPPAITNAAGTEDTSRPAHGTSSRTPWRVQRSSRRARCWRTRWRRRHSCSDRQTEFNLLNRHRRRRADRDPATGAVRNARFAPCGVRRRTSSKRRKGCSHNSGNPSSRWPRRARAFAQ